MKELKGIPTERVQALIRDAPDEKKFREGLCFLVDDGMPELGQEERSSLIKWTYETLIGLYCHSKLPLSMQLMIERAHDELVYNPVLYPV